MSTSYFVGDIADATYVEPAHTHDRVTSDFGRIVVDVLHDPLQPDGPTRTSITYSLAPASAAVLAGLFRSLGLPFRGDIRVDDDTCEVYEPRIIGARVVLARTVRRWPALGEEWRIVGRAERCTDCGGWYAVDQRTGRAVDVKPAA